MTLVAQTANVHAADYASYSTRLGFRLLRAAPRVQWYVLRDTVMTDETIAEGIVEEALPNTLFRVRVGDQLILAYLAGKMRLHRIKVLVGDKVTLQLDPYGGRARITRRV